MLNCTKCKKIKPFSAFTKRNSKRGYKSHCNACVIARQKVARKLRRQNGYFIYILPEEHYAGATKDPNYRMIEHRKKGKNTDGWRIMFHTFELAEARKVEAEFHMLGFNGVKRL